MKITNSQIKQIIREEIALLKEGLTQDPSFTYLDKIERADEKIKKLQHEASELKTAGDSLADDEDMDRARLAWDKVDELNAKVETIRDKIRPFRAELAKFFKSRYGTSEDE